MRIFRAGLLLAFMGMMLAAATSDTAPVPRKAPELVFNTMDGKQLLLSSYRGKAVVIAFMFTTCPHCQALCPTLISIQNDYKAKGVQFLGNMIDDHAKEGLDDFSKNYSREVFPIGWGTKEAALEFMKHPDPLFYVPMLAFVDKTGMIQAQYIGNNEDFFSNPDKNIRMEIDKVLSGKAAPKVMSKK